MIDKLRLNTKLFSFGGIIGRRDYVLNLVCIWAINVFFVLPYNAWLFTKAETFSDFMNLSGLFISSPIFLKIWFILGTILVSVLTVSNAIKRLNDILGKENNVLNICVSILFVFALFSIMLPILLCILISFIATIVGFILIFKKGEITSKYPYDVTKVFNWGAFLGTWIWGLFNKSYVPLFMLLLFWTPWSFCFQLYCGLKGNEWAYKNKKWKNVQTFNKSQEKQTTFWAVFNLLIIPISYFVLVFGIIFYLFSGVASDSPEKREVAKQRMEKFENFLVDVGSSYFTNYKITENENIFYIEEDEWKFSLYSDKKEILEMAARISVHEKEKTWEIEEEERQRLKQLYANNPEELKKVQKYKRRPTKYSELPKTKIYGAKTGQLLAEYVDNGVSAKDTSFPEYVKKTINSYRFYNVAE